MHNSRMSRVNAATLIQSLLSKVQDVLVPGRCVLCGDSSCKTSLCLRCRDILPVVTNACERCAAALPARQLRGVACGRCQIDLPLFERTIAVLQYAYPVDVALKALKFNAKLHYAPAFADLMLPLLQTEFPGCDALVPVPLHRWRHAGRGFNQAGEIAGTLARKSGVPMRRSVLRIRATPSQSGLDADARRRNLQHAFAAQRLLRCRHPVIVDDVMTTGETCRQIARVLIEAGAESVGVLVVARA
jgi:ComF family protein